MSSDDQYFLNVLSSIPNDVKRYSLDIAESIDRHFEIVATTLRETLASSSWIPESARPSPPRPPQPPPLPERLYQRAQDWISNNKALTAAVVVSVSATGLFIYSRRRGYVKKRRASRARNGARKEVVVVAGSPKEPISRSLSLDLERRGFIVYVVVSTLEEEQMIQSEAREDIRPLNVNIADPTSSQEAVDRFHRMLLQPQQAFPGAGPHSLHLAGVILIPDMIYPSGPVETITPDLWSDALNVKVLGTIATTQAFLRPIHDSKARVLVLTPSIVPALAPPFHSVESSIVAALEGFSSSLRGELGSVGIDVCHFKLGSFDCGAVGGKTHLQAPHAARADVLSWPAAARAAYARNYCALASAAGSRSCVTGVGANGGPRGSPLRELHNDVFDALTVARPRRVWHVGSGSLLYGVVGGWVPAGIVGWMLGLRRVSSEEVAEGSDTVDWEKVDRMV